MQRVRAVAAAMLAAVLTGAPAIAAPPPAQDEAAIRAVLDDETSAWARGDADAFAAHVMPDVVFTNIVGMFSVGKAPFTAQHRSIFTTIYKGSTVRLFVQHIAHPTPDVAVVDVVAVLSGFNTAPGGIPLLDGKEYARLEQVMVRTPDGWRVAAFHNVAIQPTFVDADVRALTASAPH